MEKIEVDLFLLNIVSQQLLLTLTQCEWCFRSSSDPLESLLSFWWCWWGHEWMELLEVLPGHSWTHRSPVICPWGRRQMIVVGNVQSADLTKWCKKCLNSFPWELWEHVQQQSMGALPASKLHLTHPNSLPCLTLSRQRDCQFHSTWSAATAMI